MAQYILSLRYFIFTLLPLGPSISSAHAEILLNGQRNLRDLHRIKPRNHVISYKIHCFPGENICKILKVVAGSLRILKDPSKIRILQRTLKDLYKII